jgi:hypothetical protein
MHGKDAHMWRGGEESLFFHLLLEMRLRAIVVSPLIGLMEQVQSSICTIMYFT